MPKRDNDDLFAESTMTFGEHLEDLRRCLVRALLCLAAGMVIALSVSDWVVQVINGPLEQSLQGYYETDAVSKYRQFAEDRTAAGKPNPYTLAQVEQFIDKQHFIYKMYFVHPDAVRMALGLESQPAVPTPPSPVAKNEPEPAAEKTGQEPLPKSSPDEQEADPQAESEEDEKFVPLSVSDLVPFFVWRPMDDDERMSIKSLSPTEAFMIWLKAALVTGFVFASPLIFYFIWSFVAAGLYPHEKKYVHIFLPFSVILFLSGAFFCFFGVFPIVLKFLFAFNADLGINPDPRISEWLSFAIFLPIGFGLSFQLPLVMLFLERIGILNVAGYLAKWRMAVLVIFVISMILTPADPMSMLAMALPLVALYFLGIVLCRYFPKRKGFLEE
ncbi:MAG TPA: twin-arginine translocase subunit TatC [Pirellulales bacterium]|nr:twin-arginine translocase subunit TatC [Pirellulales bacterium]